MEDDTKVVRIEMQKNVPKENDAVNNNNNGNERKAYNGGEAKIGIATMKSLTRLAAKARRNKIEKKKENVVKNIHFRGASWLDDNFGAYAWRLK